jgi:hypothetical protein
MAEMTLQRKATIVRAIEDHAARYAYPHNPMVNDPARYVAEGHVPGGATSQEWEWIAAYIEQHPGVLTDPPLTIDQLRELNRVREANADAIGEQAKERFEAGDYPAARRLVEQAELIDPPPGPLAAGPRTHQRGRGDGPVTGHVLHVLGNLEAAWQTDQIADAAAQHHVYDEAPEWISPDPWTQAACVLVEADTLDQIAAMSLPRRPGVVVIAHDLGRW